MGTANPVPEWLPDSCWQSVLALKEISDYHALAEDLVSSSKRWREWLELERPEDEPLPGELPPCLPIPQAALAWHATHAVICAAVQATGSACLSSAASCYSTPCALIA